MLIQVLFQASRPKTISAAIVPVFAGTALAHRYVTVSWTSFTFALLSAVCIQIGTNYMNDALDYKKGADTDERLGPMRAIQRGIMSPELLFRAGLFAIFLAILFGVPLVMRGGMPILLIGLISTVLAYGYTGGPYPLAYNGLGEIFVILFFGIIAVGGTFYLHTLNFSGDAIILGAQIGLLATSLIAINNYRDHEQDLNANKRTLAVLLGLTGARLIVVTSLLLPFFIGLYWLFYLPAVFFIPLLLFPFGLLLTKIFLRTQPSKECNKLLGMAALLHLLFGAMISLALII